MKAPERLRVVLYGLGQIGLETAKVVLSRRDIEQIWDLQHYLKNVDLIFNRVFH